MSAEGATVAVPVQGARRDLATISLAFFFAFLGTGASQPFVVGYLNEVHRIPLARASLVLSSVYFTFLVFRFFIGFVIDLTGLHRAKILGVAAYCLFPVILYFGHDFPVFLAGGILWGIGAPMLWTSALVQVMNVSATTRYGAAAGIVHGTVTLAQFLGLFLLPVVYTRYGYRPMFLSAAALGLIAIACMAASPNRPIARRRPELRTLGRVMGDKRSRLVALFMLASGLGYGGVVLNGFKAHIETIAGQEWLGIIFPLFPLGGMLSGYFGGRLCDRFGRWQTFAGGFCIGAAGMLLAVLTAEPSWLLLAMPLIGVQSAIVPLSAVAWIGDTTSPDERPSVMGYVLCFRDLGTAIGIVAGGIVAVRQALLLFVAVSVACAVAAAWEEHVHAAGQTLHAEKQEHS